MVPTVPLMSLWLPILVSAVLVFIASSVIHMMIGYHRADYRRVPAEDDTAEALRKAAIPPGDYMLPSPGSRNAMKDPVFRELVEPERLRQTTEMLKAIDRVCMLIHAAQQSPPDLSG